MNEFFNVLIGCICSFILGLVAHSAASHVYSKWLKKWFNPEAVKE